MKICLVTPFSSEGGGGGITTHLKLTAEGLLERGHQVTVISGARDLPGETPCTIRGARMEIVSGAHGDTFGRDFWEQSAATFRRLNSEIKFDVILSEGTSAMGLMALGPGIPIAGFAHQFKAIHLFNSFQEVTSLRLLAVYALRTVPRVIRDAFSSEIPFLRRADAVICGAGHIGEAIRSFYRIRKEKIKTVRYWIDTRTFRPSPGLRAEGRRLLAAGADDFIFLTVGRLQETKGIDTALKAFSKVSASLPGARLAVVGDGVPGQMEAHRRLAEDLGISGRVIFTGLVPGESLPALYNAADLFLMPSKLLEAGPYTLLEAMACGLAIIASKRPGSVEMLGKNGFYHVPGDAGDLAGLMRKLCGDLELRLKSAEANLERSCTVFGKEAALDCLENYLKELVSSGQGADHG